MASAATAGSQRGIHLDRGVRDPRAGKIGRQARQPARDPRAEGSDPAEAGLRQRLVHHLRRPCHAGSKIAGLVHAPYVAHVA
jgi:hypothetical protein